MSSRPRPTTQADYPVGFLTLSRHGRVEAVNSEVGPLLQRSQEELLGMPFTVFLVGDCVQKFLSHLWDTFKKPAEIGSCEVDLALRDGTVCRVGLRSRATPQQGGESRSCRSVLWVLSPPDQEAQKGHELFQSLPYGAIWLDDEDVIEECNTAFCGLLDYDPASLRQCPMGRLFPQWSSEAALAASLQGRTFRVRGVRRDGVPIPVAASLHPVGGSLGHLTYLCFVRSLVAQEGLERRALRSAELERQAIGRELHDSLGQNLVGMAFLADELAAELKEHADLNEPKMTEFAARAERLARLCRGTSKITRGLVRGLVPVALAEGGLAATLRDLADWVSSISNFTCRTNCRECELPSDVAEHFFRIAQESVTNALKHSGGTRLEISLNVHADATVVLAVCDNGKGINREERQRFGTGIHSMKHRAKMIEAVLLCGIVPEGGTCVTLRWSPPPSAPCGSPESDDDACGE